MTANTLRHASDREIVAYYEADRRKPEHEAGRERAPLLREFLVASAIVQDGCRSVLDVGCGDGHLALLLARLGIDVTVMDATADAVIEARSRCLAAGFEISGRYGLVERLDFLERYDAVVCCETIEHLRDPRSAVVNLARAARRIVVLTTPFSTCYDDPSHLHHWESAEDLAASLDFDTAFGGNYQIEASHSRWGDDGRVFVVIGRPAAFGDRMRGATVGK